MKLSVCRSAVWFALLLTLLGFTTVAAQQAPAASTAKDVKAKNAKAKASANELAVTTASEKARALYRAAITDFENLRVDSALDGWRAAVKLDPAFAMAHSHIAFYTTDAAEGAAARARAKELAPKMSAAEKLYIQWVNAVREGDTGAGISAMNDLVGQYPKDKNVLYEAGNWLLLQRAFEPARHLLDRTIALDKNFAPGLNDLGRISEPTMDQALVVVPARGRKPSAP